MSELMDVLLEKLRKPFWRAFSISWITWNWQIWYITIFISSDGINGNKLSYIIDKYSYFNNYKEHFEVFGLNFYNLIFPELAIILHWFLIPLLLSYGVVWHFSKITDRYLEKNKENKKRENEILQEEIESETTKIESETTRLKAEKEKILAEFEKGKAEKEKILAEFEKEKKKLEAQLKESQSIKEDKYALWNSDFFSIDKDILNLLSVFIYSYGGTFRGDTVNGMNLERNKLAEKLQILHSYELIDLDRNSAKPYDVYNITEKGRYFLKKSHENS